MNPSTAIHAAELNARGIQALDDRCFEESIKLFSRALNIVKQVMASAEQQGDDCDIDCCDAEESSVCQFAQLQSSKLSDVNGPFVFRNPMFVIDGSIQPTTFRYYVVLSFVLLYNLALCHHLSALDVINSNDANRKRHLLIRSLSLYELAYTVQMTEELELAVLQTMALVNNLGQIHLALGAAQKSQQCMEHLLSTIMFVNDCGEQSNIQEMEGFVANVMPLIAKSDAAPAA